MIEINNRSRRITHNTLFLYGSTVVARLISWVLLSFLTRRWDQVGTYGQYALALNWVAIVGIFSELGLNAFVVREVAHHRETSLYYLRNTIAIRSALSLFFLLGLIGSAFVLDYEPVLKVAMAVLGLRILLDSISGAYAYLLQAHEMMGFCSMVNIWAALIRLVGIVGVVLLGGGVVAACVVWTVASIMALVSLVVKGRQMGWRPEFPRLRFQEAADTLIKAFPLATFSALQMLYYRVDSLLLKSLTDNETVGFYDLATKILFVILSFSQILSTAAFPALSSVQDDRPAFGRMLGKIMKALLLTGIPASVGGWFLAKPIILLISGPKYLPAVPIFATLMLSVAPYFLCHVYSFSLGIYDNLRLNLQFAGLFVLNVILNFILIPHEGGVGAAWATVLCEILGLISGFAMAASHMKGFSWRSLARPLLASLGASALMGWGVHADPRLYWILLGPLVYGIAFWLFRGLTQEDRDSLASILQIRKNRN